jgi:hypothetical protein
MLQILTVGYGAGIVVSVAGGILFAQWPRPSLVEWFRISGAALGFLGFLLTGTLALYVHLFVSSELPTFVWLTIGVTPSVGVWLMCAYLTDRLTGYHLFGGEVGFEIALDEHDEPKHIDLRV